jgi:hypothetical protein
VTFTSHWTKSPTLFDRGDLINLLFRSYLIPSLSFNVIEAIPLDSAVTFYQFRRSSHLTGEMLLHELKGRKVKRLLFTIARPTYIRNNCFLWQLWLSISCEKRNLEWYLTVIMWLSYLLSKKKKQEEEEQEEEEQAAAFQVYVLVHKKKCITLLQQRISRSKQACLLTTHKGGDGGAQSEPAPSTHQPSSPCRKDGWCVDRKHFCVVFSVPLSTTRWLAMY